MKTTITRRARIWIWAVACLASGVLAGNPPVDITQDAKILQDMLAKDHRDLRNSGTATPADHKALDDTALALAREAEIKRTQALSELGQKALGNPDAVKQGPLGSDPQKARGVMGDVDTPALSRSDFDKVIKAAKDAGYHVDGAGDYQTIKELNTTVHRDVSPYSSPQGSSANQQEVGRGYGKETSQNYGVKPEDLPPGDPRRNINVMDNLKKGANTLDTPPAEMTAEQVQNLGKMTQRNMAAGGVQNEPLSAQAQMLKDGYSPESAGIVKPNASDAEATAQLGKFQQDARAANVQAAQNTMADANAKGQQLQSAADQAQAKYQAAQESGNPQAVEQARGELQTARQELVNHNTQQAAAQDGFVSNQPEGAKLLNDINGNPVQKVTGPNGEVGYKAPNGETLTPSQARDNALVPAEGKVPATANAPAGETPPEGPVGATSTATKGAGIALGLLNLYQSTQQGAQQAVDEAKPGDSDAKTYGKAVGYSTYNATGIPAAIDSGTAAGNEAMDQYNKDKADGKDPSWLWAKTKGAVLGIGNFLGGKTDGIAIAEGWGLIKDWYQEHQNNNNAEEMEAWIKQHKADMAAAGQHGDGPLPDTTKPLGDQTSVTPSGDGSQPGQPNNGLTTQNNQVPGQPNDGQGGMGGTPDQTTQFGQPNTTSVPATPGDLVNAEPTAGNGSNINPFNQPPVLNSFTTGRNNDLNGQATSAFGNMQIQTKNQQTASIPDDSNQLINNLLTGANNDAANTRNAATTANANQQGNLSWGSTLGNAAVDSFTAGFTSFGTAAGQGAAGAVNTAIQNAISGGPKNGNSSTDGSGGIQPPASGSDSSPPSAPPSRSSGDRPSSGSGCNDGCSTSSGGGKGPVDPDGDNFAGQGGAPVDMNAVNNAAAQAAAAAAGIFAGGVTMGAAGVKPTPQNIAPFVPNSGSSGGGPALQQRKDKATPGGKGSSGGPKKNKSGGDSGGGGG